MPGRSVAVSHGLEEGHATGAVVQGRRLDHGGSVWTLRARVAPGADPDGGSTEGQRRAAGVLRGRTCRSSPRRFAAASSRRAKALIARMTIPKVSMAAILRAGLSIRNRANVMSWIGRMTYGTSPETAAPTRA